VANICQGRIVWSEVADKNGYNKYHRPIVLLTADREIPQKDTLYGVVSSSTAARQKPLPEYCLMLPWQRDGHVVTKLCEPSAAVCNWIVEIKKDSIESLAGIVPPKLLVKILLKCNEYFN